MKNVKFRARVMVKFLTYAELLAHQAQLDIEHVAAGGRAMIVIDGGATRADMSLRDGVPWVVTRGRFPSLHYDGPALQCQVGCGMGRWARELAERVLEVRSRD